MILENSNQFSVLDMAQTYASENDIDVEDLFKNPAKTPKTEISDESITEEPAAEFSMKPILKEDSKEPQSVITGPGQERKPWKPDDSLLEDMPEVTAGPVIYNNEDIKEEILSKELGSVVDTVAQNSGVQAMDDMTRKNYHIDKIKTELGIGNCRIPEGEFHAMIFTAAGDVDSKRAMDGLREIFTNIIINYPEFILDWTDPSKNPHNKDSKDVPVKDVPVPAQQIQSAVVSEEEVDAFAEPLSVPESNPTTPTISSGDAEETKIVIDKTNLPEIAWTSEELEKIRKSRSVELNIVEDVTLKYTNIEDIDENTVDIVLSQYIRKAGDVAGALPASKYRATFTGLTYTEILDLSYSQELNNIDGERKKWSIAFDHVKNQSIGPWQIEDIKNKEGEILRTTTEFEDFLKKTSFMDLEFILWKILCATAMDKEIISIDCHGTFNGSPCNRNYDWIYSPRELLVMDSMNPAVLEEMKKTIEAGSEEEIIKNYQESMLNTKNTIELPTSKIGVIFGHVSAYEYLNFIYPEIHDMQNQTNPMLSEALAYSTLTVIKNFLVPQGDDKFGRIKGVKQLIRVINTLDEIDWQTISELVRIMLEPYQFRFELRNIRCPQCKTKSNITVEDMSKLLFIVAQSLSNVQVVLKKT